MGSRFVDLHDLAGFCLKDRRANRAFRPLGHTDDRVATRPNWTAHKRRKVKPWYRRAFHSGTEFVETSERDLNSGTDLGSGCIGLGSVFRLVTTQA